MAKKKVGRPTIFNEKLADEICRRIAEKESLRSICKDAHMPNISTVIDWVLQGNKDDASENLKQFSAQYAHARDVQIEAFMDECIDIADDSSQDWMDKELKNGETVRVVDYEHINRSRERIDVRKWFAARMKPKKYGDKIQQEITGKDGKDIIPIINIVDASPKK